MPRKMMTKEVTKTVVKIGKLEMVDGQPQAIQLPDETLIGNINMEKAQKLMNKKHGTVTVFSVEPNTTIYEMEVEEFIKLASIKEQ